MNVTDVVKDKVVTAYNEAVLKGEVSFAAIGQSIGVSGTHVKQILLQAGIENPISTAKRGRKSLVGRDALSDTHALIGRRLTLHRLEKSRTEYGAMVGMSSSAISAAESGHYDLTLCNIQSLAAHMGVTVEELMKEKK